jgi:hypothetical protein
MRKTQSVECSFEVKRDQKNAIALLRLALIKRVISVLRYNFRLRYSI